MWILVYIFFIILNFIAYFVPKRLYRIEIYSTTLFALLFGIVVDLILNLHYGLYGYFDRGFQWRGLIGEFLSFIPISILFLNYYPLHKSYKSQLFYILIWSVISTIIEWLMLKTEFFNEYEWELWYSAVAYPFIFLILVIDLKIIKKLLKQASC
ncbi:CBO0543 family protein [Priestia aryabhattai]|uniref:CBO0543 family protein n=1 Tax=Priestia aryabhattai TaxID=412384 RepID=UPI0035A19E78